MPTEEQHAVAILAALNAALVPIDSRAYDLDEVPATFPATWVTVALSWRFGGERRASGEIGAQGWRIVTRCTARTSLSNARNLRRVVDSVLRDKRVIVAGEPTGRITFDSGQAIAPDSGYYSGADTWTYVL